jgi:hypothetical protein
MTNAEFSGHGCCICGYQNKINRLMSDLEIAERRLIELGNNLQHAITQNYELRNKLGRPSDR